MKINNDLEFAEHDTLVSNLLKSTLLAFFPCKPNRLIAAIDDFT